MNSPKLTLIIACSLFFFISILHFRMVDDEKKDPYALQIFKEEKDINKSSPLKNNRSKKKNSLQTEKIPINEATVEDIRSVSGFGEKLAQVVITAREKAGGKLNDKIILGISGIGEGKLSALKEKFIIPPAPIDVTLASFSEVDAFSADQCPYCKKELSSHDRKKHESYIYCPHCLKYLPEKQK